jgi:hypothetical protein
MSRQTGHSFVIAWGSIIALVILVGYLLFGPAESPRFGHRPRSPNTNNLKYLALAMHAYHDFHGTFPPSALYDKQGNALLSWRVLILPFLEEKDLYRQFHLNEPWDSPHNSSLLKKMPKVFLHPKQPPGADPFTTNYLALVGEGAAFEGRAGVNVAEFTDGTANTLFLVESAGGVPWSKPEDLHYSSDTPLPRIGGIYPDGFTAALADASVRFISIAASEKTLRAAITRNGHDEVGKDLNY